MIILLSGIFNGYFSFTLNFVLSLDMLCIVGSLRDSVLNGDVRAVRQFLTAETRFSAVRPEPSGEYHPADDKMTLLMLAARHGQLKNVLLGDCMLCRAAYRLFCLSVILFVSHTQALCQATKFCMFIKN